MEKLVLIKHSFGFQTCFFQHLYFRSFVFSLVENKLISYFTNIIESLIIRTIRNHVLRPSISIFSILATIIIHLSFEDIRNHTFLVLILPSFLVTDLTDIDLTVQTSTWIVIDIQLIIEIRKLIIAISTIHCLVGSLITMTDYSVDCLFQIDRTIDQLLVQTRQILFSSLTVFSLVQIRAWIIEYPFSFPVEIFAAHFIYFGTIFPDL